MLKAIAARVRKAGVLWVLGAAFVLAPVAGQAAKIRRMLVRSPPLRWPICLHKGGPPMPPHPRGWALPTRKDGTVFGNRERILPAQKRGYYREYTVKTPGARNRGARRIVCGGQQPRMPDACYYTSDHYASFRVIVN